MLAKETIYFLWSIIPALLLGYGTHSFLVGGGVLLIMAFITSLDRQMRQIVEKMDTEEKRKLYSD